MTLVANEEFIQAAEIADRIDWRKVRSFSMLQKISDLYKINRRFEESLEILLLAYDRNPNSRTIVYSMCELYIELNDLVSALQYLALYKKMAPYDTGVYILQYKIKEFAEAPIEERIELLEELNRKDYREEWAYQLAYLYHRIGLATKCIEACDQLITWFGEGPFVIKAMELKMLHTKLSPKQQELYNHRNDIAEQIEAYESDNYTSEKPEPGAMPELLEDEDFHVKTIDMSKFNTINLQKALAESMRELMGEDDEPNQAQITQKLMEPMMDTDPLLSTDEILANDAVADLEEAPEVDESYYSQGEEGEYSDEQYTEGEEGYSGEYIEEYQEEYTEDGYEQEFYEDEPVYEMADDNEYAPTNEDAIAEEIDITSDESSTIDNSEVYFEDKTTDILADTAAIAMLDVHRIVSEASKGAVAAIEATKGGHFYDEKSGLEDILSLDIDGQISLAIPKDVQVEKQITGQMNLDEVLVEWEKLKEKKNKQQHDEIKQNIMDKTGQIFTDYDSKLKDDILARLEEEEQKNNRIISNDLELTKADDLKFVDSQDFDATAALNKEYDTSIWDEVDAAIAAEQLEEAALAGGALAAEEALEAGLEASEALGEALVDGVEALSDIAQDEGEPSIDVSMEMPTEDAEDTEDVEYADEYEDEPVEEYYEDADGNEYYEDEYPEDYEDEQVYDYDPEDDSYIDELNTSEISSIESALVAAADKEAVDTIDEMNDDYHPDDDMDFSNDEIKLFGDFLYSKKMRKQILDAVNQVCLESYVGNVIITGDKGTGDIELAKSMIKELQLIDGNFISSKVAKISGSKMNKKDVPSLFMQLAGGALIIEKAGSMTKDTLENITITLENAENGILVVMTDTKKAIDKLLSKYNIAENYFNARVDIVPMNDRALVEYAKKYAYSREYKIDDEKGVLALHQRINELQIGDHNVTTREIEDIVDDAIDHAKRPRLSNVFKVIAGKRYDHEDMIILQESDFV